MCVSLNQLCVFTPVFLKSLSRPIYSSGNYTDNAPVLPIEPVAVQAFKRHRQDLLAAIENALQLFQHMTSRNFLTDSTRRRLLAGPPTAEANVQLLDEIEQQLLINPSIFHSLVNLLQADRMLQSFASKLLDTYRESHNH